MFFIIRFGLHVALFDVTSSSSQANCEEKLAEDVKNLGDTLTKFKAPGLKCGMKMNCRVFLSLFQSLGGVNAEEDLERRLKDMNGETDKKAKSQKC